MASKLVFLGSIYVGGVIGSVISNCYLDHHVFMMRNKYCSTLTGKDIGNAMKLSFVDNMFKSVFWPVYYPSKLINNATE